MLRKVFVAFSYLAVAVALVVTTIILVAYGQGYSYNFKTHTFNLNGLLVLDSIPQGANISINGKPTRHRTPYRTTMEAGTYTIEITKDGYIPWRKDVTIKASEVSYVSQIVFVPKQLRTDTVSSEGPVTGLIASQDQKRFAYITGGANPAVWSLNPEKRQSTKLYAARAARDDVAAETLSSIVFSEDASHILVRTQVGATPNYIVVPFDGGSAVNLTDLFKFDLAGLTFSSYDWRELYWISPEGLRRINVEAQTVSAVLIDKVSAFTFAGDRLIYIQQTPLGKTLSSSDRSGRDNKRIIESLADSPSYEMQYVSYRGHDLLAVLPSQAATATIYIEVLSPNPVSRVLSKSVQHIAFSPEGRYLAFYGDTTVGSYDFDKDKLTASEITDGKLAALSWFDNDHLLLTRGGKLELTEVDNGNPTTIAHTSYTGPGYGLSDQRRLVWLAGNESDYKIQVADLRP